jgi:Flp pilus assembly protein TadG
MRLVTNRPEIRDDADAGAVLVWVALMIVVLVGVGALVIDVGAILVERRELQNGADAAVLAVVQDCAKVGGTCGTGALAEQYADLNAKDGAAAVTNGTPCGSGPGLPACAEPAPSGATGALGWARVDTSTQTSDGGSEVSFVLAPLLGALTGKTVTASAVAAYGIAGTLTADLTMAFSECEFQNQLKDGETIPSGLATVYLKVEGEEEDPLSTCSPRTSSGGTSTGGFAWLGTTETCKIESVQVGEVLSAPTQPGNQAPDCIAGNLVRGKPLVLPLFNIAEGTGSNVAYTISGFIGFEFTDYQLAGPDEPLSTFTCPPPAGSKPSGKYRCIQGYFRPLVLGDGEFGGSVDFGVRVIKMIG